jgi:hypothetical protein
MPPRRDRVIEPHRQQRLKPRPLLILKIVTGNHGKVIYTRLKIQETRPSGASPLRLLREHGLIERIPRTHRYQVTPAGLHHAMFLTRVHDRVLQAGIAQLSSPAPSALRHADRAYQAVIRDLTRTAGVAA